jgi:hypothetical protein
VRSHRPGSEFAHVPGVQVRRAVTSLPFVASASPSSVVLRLRSGPRFFVRRNALEDRELGGQLPLKPVGVEAQTFRQCFFPRFDMVGVREMPSVDRIDATGSSYASTDSSDVFGSALSSSPVADPRLLSAYFREAPSLPGSSASDAFHSTSESSSRQASIEELDSAHLAPPWPSPRRRTTTPDSASFDAPVSPTPSTVEFLSVSSSDNISTPQEGEGDESSIHSRARRVPARGTSEQSVTAADRAEGTFVSVANGPLARLSQEGSHVPAAEVGGYAWQALLGSDDIDSVASRPQTGDHSFLLFSVALHIRPAP